MLEVRLIGKFDIQCDGKPVIISSRAAQSLFAYLILTAGTFHRREKLAGMLWPDESDQKARTYLRNEIWRIRKALPHTSNVEYLLADNLTVGFNQSSVYWLDTADLQNADDPGSTDELINTLSNSRGELLPGFYEDWAVLERELVQARFEQKMACLLELLEKEQRWNYILDWAERWISFGQAPEAAYRALILAYESLGNHAKGVSTYERCKQDLRELDLEPSEQTRALVFKRNPKLNIPIPLTSFVGREKELQEIAGLFSKSRLVTLTGSGGVGKTRLAIQVVAEVLDLFPDGVWFLDLAPLSDPSMIPHTLVNLLGLRESGETPVTELLINYFHSRTALVIFDNCEHLIDSCAQLIFLLLTSSEHLTVLATSRESLRVSGEFPYRVPSLEIPKSNTESTILNELSNIESVQLFKERAEFASLDFALNSQNAFAIAQICQRLDGIPLALELAAARVSILTVEQILTRLDDRFNLLTHGLRSSLPRQQTLRAMIEWSYDLLTEKERLLFKRLTVFSGGWTLEAAEQVCNSNSLDTTEILALLSQLINKSLVLVEATNGASRYRRLETIHQFAREKLSESGEEQQVRSSHLYYFLKLAQKAEPEIHGAGQVEWSQKLVAEHENMRAALEWSFQVNLAVCQELAGALWWSWNFNGYLREGYEWLSRILEVTQGDETLIRARLLSGAGWLAALLNYDDHTIRAFSEASIALCDRLGEKEGKAFPLGILADLASVRLDYDQAMLLAKESCSLYREARNRWGLRLILGILGDISVAQGNFEQALKYFEESLSICKEIGDREGIGWIFYNLGKLAESQADDTRALALYGDALQIERAMKSKSVATWILERIGVLSIHRQDYERAKLSFEEALELKQIIGNQVGIAHFLQNLGWIARLKEDFLQARSYYAESLQLYDQIQDKRIISEGLIHTGQLMAVQGSPEKFAHLLGVAEMVVPEIYKLMEPFFRIETDKLVENARATLGDKAYNAAWETGRQMNVDEAITYALEELQ